MFNKPTTVAIAGSLLIGLWPFSSVLADEVDDAKAERCILITRIANTHVLDDRRILFYMRGKKAYLNLLPHRCGGLGMQRRFMYETSQSQLCDLDTISVLYNRGGEFSRGGAADSRARGDRRTAIAEGRSPHELGSDLPVRPSGPANRIAPLMSKRNFLPLRPLAARPHYLRPVM